MASRRSEAGRAYHHVGREELITAEHDPRAGVPSSTFRIPRLAAAARHYSHGETDGEDKATQDLDEARVLGVDACRTSLDNLRQEVTKREQDTGTELVESTDVRMSCQVGAARLALTALMKTMSLASRMQLSLNFSKVRVDVGSPGSLMSGNSTFFSHADVQTSSKIGMAN